MLSSASGLMVVTREAELLLVFRSSSKALTITKLVAISLVRAVATMVTVTLAPLVMVPQSQKTTPEEGSYTQLTRLLLVAETKPRSEGRTSARRTEVAGHWGPLFR